jgi:hypothetical protein
MKKIFLVLAIALLAFNGQAQNNTYTKSTMVVLVTEAKKTFAKGTNYNDWVKGQIGTAIPTVQESNVLKDIYGFLSTNQGPENIFKNYDGASLLAFGRTKNSISAFSESAARCGWRCLIIHIAIWFYETFGDYESP